MLRPARTPSAFAAVRPWRARITVAMPGAYASGLACNCDRGQRAVPQRVNGSTSAVDTHDLAGVRAKATGPTTSSGWGCTTPTSDELRRSPTLRPAPACRRGRDQRPSAAQGRAVRRLAVHRPQDPLVRRRGGCRRDRRDQPVRRPQVRRHRAARLGRRPERGPPPLEGHEQRPRPRPLRGRVRRVRRGGRPLRGGGRVASGGRRRGREVGVLHRAHQRLRPHLHPQARARRDAASGDAAAGADEQVHRRDGRTASTATPRPYFRDVADHLNRVAETIDSLDTLLSTAFDAHIAQISIQQNDDMRRISAAVGLVAAPTLIGSIYGMNFDHMPELHWLLRLPDGARSDGAQLTGRVHHQQARRLAVSLDGSARSGDDHAGPEQDQGEHAEARRGR